MSPRKKAMPHSPEPWSVVDGAEIMSRAGTEEETHVAECKCDNWFVPADEIKAANARRLVACLNAFVGWDIEAIEALAAANLACRAAAGRERQTNE